MKYIIEQDKIDYMVKILKEFPYGNVFGIFNILNDLEQYKEPPKPQKDGGSKDK